ncbi:hypothetical protein VKS41_005509 [Umbelopsis sp. WA50703]
MAPPRVPALPRLRILCPSRRRNLTQMDPLQKLQEDSLKKKDENTIAWSKKLVGKTFVDDGAEHNLSEDQVFRRKDLPKLHRVLRPDSMMTMDYRLDRLNVRVDGSNKVKSVDFS